MRSCLDRVLVTVFLGTTVSACFTFETTLPGTLDLRKPLSLPQNAELEPQRSAFGDDGAFQSVVLTESSDAPTQGHYAEASSEQVVYRRVMRQWFVLGLFPLLADATLVKKELKERLAQPGSKASEIRITSGFDLVEVARTVCLSPIPVVNLVQLAPGRSTEVVAFIAVSGDRPARILNPEPPPLPAVSPSDATAVDSVTTDAPPSNPSAPVDGDVVITDEIPQGPIPSTLDPVTPVPNALEQ